MSEQIPPLPWARPGWFARISAWIHAELARQGIDVRGPIEQPHARPWSTVLRVPTTAGTIYCKATAPVLAHEPALTQALARWRPDCMPRVLAIDSEHGWMLLVDGGAPLRGLLRSPGDLRHWRRVLPLYAEAQIALAGRCHELLALGALDRRLAVLPAQYEWLLADTATLRIGQPAGLTAEEYQRLRARAPRVAALCERLAGHRVPETLHHDDFHDGNIFVRDGRYTFADWGESCAAHPFFTLVVTLRSVAYRLGRVESDREVARLRDVYLEPWARYASREHLLVACELARRLGMVCRALTWHRVVSGLEEPLKGGHAEAVPGWLREFLDAETRAAA